ncbi:SPIR1 protein, partial [Spelaeornis formosus]|nr:SPIR1 protein [Elachura formosa]
MESPDCEQRIVKVSLAEILKCFDHPISEEQAWAICFQCCRKIEQLTQRLCPPLCPVFIEGSGSIFIHADGTASFKVYHKSGKIIGTCGCQRLLLEYLGLVIYGALDWGIDSQVERELSDPLEKLLCLMLKLDDEATKPPVTLQDVCEEHLSKSSQAISHYEITCRSLFTEYMELQKLVTIIQTSKEVCLGLPISCYSLCLHNSPMRSSKASPWLGVICELQTGGVRLRKAAERPWRCVSPKERIRSPYELLLDDIQHRRYTLRKVIVLSPLLSLLCPMAHCGAMLCLQMLKVKLQQHVLQEPRWHEELMAGKKQLPQLCAAEPQEKRSRPKGTCY